MTIKVEYPLGYTEPEPSNECHSIHHSLSNKMIIESFLNHGGDEDPEYDEDEERMDEVEQPVRPSWTYQEKVDKFNEFLQLLDDENESELGT